MRNGHEAFSKKDNGIIHLTGTGSGTSASVQGLAQPHKGMRVDQEHIPDVMPIAHGKSTLSPDAAVGPKSKRGQGAMRRVHGSITEAVPGNGGGKKVYTSGPLVKSHDAFISKARKGQESPGRAATATAFGATHSILAARKGQKTKATLNSAGHNIVGSVGGAVAGSAVGGLTREPMIAGMGGSIGGGIGGMVGNHMAYKSNAAQGRYKRISKSHDAFLVEVVKRDFPKKRQATDAKTTPEVDAFIAERKKKTAERDAHVSKGWAGDVVRMARKTGHGVQTAGRAYHGLAGYMGDSSGVILGSKALEASGKGHKVRAAALGRLAGPGLTHPHATGYGILLGPSTVVTGADVAERRHRVKKSHDAFLVEKAFNPLGEGGDLGRAIAARPGVVGSLKSATRGPSSLKAAQGHVAWAGKEGYGIGHETGLGRGKGLGRKQGLAVGGAVGAGAGLAMPKKNTNQY